MVHHRIALLVLILLFQQERRACAAAFSGWGIQQPLRTIPNPSHKRRISVRQQATVQHQDDLASNRNLNGIKDNNQHSASTESESSSTTVSLKEEALEDHVDVVIVPQPQSPSASLFSPHSKGSHRPRTIIVKTGSRFRTPYKKIFKEQLLEQQRLQKENMRLRQALKRIQIENERLRTEIDKRVIVEIFEGEGKLKRAASEEDDDDYNNNVMECALDGDACPIEPTISFGEAFRDRALWLIGLLAMQSCSGFILAQNEALLVNHPFIVYFLTMLVGAGGNAGNQASVRVIRGLAIGTLNADTQRQFLTREFKMAACLSGVLALAGFLRATLFHTPLAESLAVTMALALIVFSSVCLGAVLPLVLKRFGVDPAHSSTTIQVIMDILGVVLAVLVSSLLLDSPLGVFLVSQLTGGGASR